MTAEQLSEILARDVETGNLWFRGPVSFAAHAARDRRALVDFLKDLAASDLMPLDCAALLEEYTCGKVSVLKA